MSAPKNDPVGQAILDFAQNTHATNIVVASDICDDDVIPVSMLFRSHDEMPPLEQTALTLCSGNILDVGAAAGVHASYLQEKGHSVEAIDISPGSVAYMQSQGINARNQNFFDAPTRTYDTLLLLMNGLGIAGSLAHLDATLLHAKKLVTVHGKIICDSTDIKYLYEDDTGGMWVDLNTDYYGDFHFQMQYKNHKSNWFEWLYVDFDRLKEAADRTGWNAELRYTDEEHYLAELTLL